MSFSWLVLALKKHSKQVAWENYDPKKIFTDPVHDNKCEDLLKGCERSGLKSSFILHCYDQKSFKVTTLKSKNCGPATNFWLDPKISEKIK